MKDRTTQYKKYRRENRQKCKAASKAWYKKNRRKILAKNKLRRKRIAAISRAHYLTNQKSILKRHSAYNKKHKKKMREYSKNHEQSMAGRHRRMLNRAKKLAARSIKGRPMSVSEHQKKIYYKDGRLRKCHYCRAQLNKSGSCVDRRNNRIGYTVRNTVPCCRGCNSWRQDVYTVQQMLDHFKPMRNAANKRRKQKCKL